MGLPGVGLWRRYLAWRQRNVTRIEHMVAGFRIVRGRQVAEMAWDGIVRVAAFKRDLMAVDLLCLLIQSDDAMVEIDEQMAGFALVLDELERRLEITPDWRLRVLFPAFETNATILYQRGAQAGVPHCNGGPRD